METKQIALVVAAVTAIINVILFASGFTHTVTCTVAQQVSAAYAALPGVFGE